MPVNLLFLVGATVLVGYFGGRLIHSWKLPSLIGYMLVGFLLGPAVFNLFSEQTIEHLSFVTEIALGFVAFTIGQELSLSSLRSLGRSIILIIFSESLCAFGVVFLLIYAVTHDLPLALVFGAMAPASAPAGTVAVIHEFRAKGRLTKALYAVVGFDDGLAIVIFGFAAAVARGLLTSEVEGGDLHLSAGLIRCVREIVLSMGVGCIIGFLFCFLLRFINEQRDIIVMVFGCVLIGAGLAVAWHLSLILTCMVIGFVLVNTRRESLVRDVARQILTVMPILFILFFCLAGAHLELAALTTLGLVGIVYILGRTAGLIGGAWLGAVIGRSDRVIRKYLGFGILSQAGVAVALSLTVKHEFSDIPSEHAAFVGASVLTTIMATCIVFEIIGPLATKIVLSKAGELGKADE